ncbi:hypothetical protein DU508_12755 [Pedobacter chinensis]|uniref:Uncharacterized protein n=1 Tax=Pedobacter chinensis TaxID=2282421 RepID=A0A369Q0C9_9SPHI|nr:hypothetical protein [Pedobacter chinensis]RDC56456.1 hypothetical protein DU508_12755 [Pedobacter chinensis]
MLETAKFTPDQSIINKLNTLVNYIPYNNDLYKDIAYIQNINNAYSTVVNMDYFSVKVNTLPIVNGQRLSPEQFMHYIRVNMNSFTDGTKTFNAYNNYGVDDRAKWNSTNPIGSILALDIAGPDDASVITSKSSSSGWTFTTIHEPMYGDHPVSGNRDFGFTENGNGSYTFYTRGVDRLTTWDGDLMRLLGNIPFNSADGLWTSFQNSIMQFVNTHEGYSNIVSPEKYRPNWDVVKDVLDGKKPLSTLSKKCPPVILEIE